MKEKELQKSIDTVLAEMKSYRVDTEEQYRAAGEFLKKCRETKNTVESFFAEPLEKAKEQKRLAELARKEVVKQIEQYTGRLDEAERTVKKIMGNYLAEVERKRREEEEKRLLSEAIDTEDETVLDEPIITQRAEVKVEGSYTVDVWKFEVTDITKINPEYLIADTAGIRKTVTALHDKAVEVVGTGIRIYKEKEVRVRL
jgi:hypothetical protein